MEKRKGYLPRGAPLYRASLEPPALHRLLAITPAEEHRPSFSYLWFLRRWEIPSTGQAHRGGVSAVAVQAFMINAG